MNNFQKILKRFAQLDAKKKSYFICTLIVTLGMLWAFISAGIITSNFNRAQLKGSENEQRQRCLINPSRLTEQFDKKVISIDFESGVEEGTVRWKEIIANFYPDLEEALEIAKGHFAVCPERVLRLTKSHCLGELADTLTKSCVWYLGWK